VQRHKNRPALRVGYRRAIVKRRIRVSLPRLHHLKSLRLQRRTHLRREFQHNIALVNPARPPRSQIRSSMRRIKHHDIQRGA